MPGNSFGQIFRLSTFGESHGLAVGGIIDGCPAGLEIDYSFVQSELNRRKPGQSALTTSRMEEDEVHWLSGIMEGIATGAPIAFLVNNKDHKSDDYEHLKNIFRPSHADYAYEAKYGIRDYRGGGRSSARETISRVVGGAIAKLILNKEGIKINAYVSGVGKVKLMEENEDLDFTLIETNRVRCPHAITAEKMITEIELAQKEGDTLGGQISCVISNVMAGLGEPVFDKLQADLAKAMLSINAVKGFEYGEGFAASSRKGSELNDAFEMRNGKVHTQTNHSGGIQGGISNGMKILFNVAFKPVSSIKQTQQTITTSGEETLLNIKGRHDACVVPRAVPIVEAMAALVLTDHLLRNKSARFEN